MSAVLDEDDTYVANEFNKRQAWTNSCGAAALLTAAKDLGVRSIPATLTGREEEPLELSRRCERFIYAFTAQAASLDEAENSWGYNLPSKMVTCAKLLGLKAYVVRKDTEAVGRLKTMFVNEFKTLKNANDVVLTSSLAKTDAPPHAHLREIKLLVQRAFGATGQITGVHWVLVRPNGDVFDPGTGGVRTMKATKSWLEMHGSGLSIYVCV